MVAIRLMVRGGGCDGEGDCGGGGDGGDGDGTGGGEGDGGGGGEGGGGEGDGGGGGEGDGCHARSCWMLMYVLESRRQLGPLS
jgi:hypothetical protein